MTAEIRHVSADDYLPWAHTMRTTFLADTKEPSEEQQAFTRRHWGDPNRRFGAYDRGRCVATLATFPTTMTVPFGDRTAEVDADALTMVSVAATHRRQGLLSTMLKQSLSDAKDRGEVVSILRAAEYPIYGRFGYWPATSAAQLKVDTARKPRLLTDAGDVTVEQVDPADLVKPGQSVYDTVRLVEHGHIARDPDEDWARGLGLEGLPSVYGKIPSCIVARESDGTPVGFVVWTPADTDADWFEGKVAINVHQLMASTTQGYVALWRYLLGMDLVGEIRLGERPVDEPLEHLLDDGRAAQPVRVYDCTWVRMLDLPAALSARRYAAADSLTFDVIDDAGGFASGRFTLDAGPDGASCVSGKGATADLMLSQRAISALYLSGRTVRSQQIAGLIDEATPGACARLQAMLFHDRAPWNATPF